jgi:hypothetical protein
MSYISNIFNKTFVESVNKFIFEKNIICTQNNTNKVSPKDSFVLLETTEAELPKVIQDTKNKKLAGLDISPFLLKKCSPYLIKPLLELVNESVRNGIFPPVLKKSVVKPIYKYGAKEDATNYRPITLVLALSMVFEVNIQSTNSIPG